MALALGVGIGLVLAFGWLLLRRRRHRTRDRDQHQPPEELAGLLTGGFALFPHGSPHGSPHPSHPDDEELDLEEGALDPDEIEGDPLYWDEGADDELG